MNQIVTKDFWDTETLLLNWFQGSKEFMVLLILMKHHMNILNEQRKNNGYRSFLCGTPIYDYDPSIYDPTGILSETILRLVQGTRKQKMNFNILKVDLKDI